MYKVTYGHRVGLTVGSLLAFVHLCWSLLIALNVAQPLLELVFRLHMIQPVYTVQQFSLSLAIGLVLFTFVVGYFLGHVLVFVWDLFKK